jgi:hypothetical protein
VGNAHNVLPLSHTVSDFQNWQLTATKKNPGHGTLPGLLQVVASACRLF